MKIPIKLNGKTFAGVGAGLLIGYFIFKKKPLGIIGTGLAGGLLANFVLNKDKKPTKKDNKTVIEEDEFENTIGKPIEKEKFEIANVVETSPKDYFDIDLGHNE